MTLKKQGLTSNMYSQEKLHFLLQEMLQKSVILLEWILYQYYKQLFSSFPFILYKYTYCLNKSFSNETIILFCIDDN